MKDGKPFMTLGNMGGAYQPLGSCIIDYQHYC